MSEIPGTDKASFVSFDFEFERTRDPIEKLHELQGVMSRASQFDEVLGTTTIPDLEAMARKSTEELTDLLKLRQDSPIEGPDQNFGVLTLGPRDEELDGMASAQDRLHGIFMRMYHHEAWLEYQGRVAFDPESQTIEEYQRAQQKHARDTAYAKCSEICPPYEEVEALVDGDHDYQQYLEERGSEEKIPRGVPLQVVSAALARVAFVLTEGNGDTEALAAIVGDNESYANVIAASEEFIRQHQGIEKHRAPSPYVMGLWIGLIAGVRAGQDSQTE